FYLYFKQMSFTQNQLNSAMRMALDFDPSSNITKTLLLSEKYFPDIYGYDFLTDLKVHTPSQSILSIFFHKRFLIKSCIESIAPDIIDCIPKILDPCMTPSNNPYFYKKFLLNIMLFPMCPITDERLNMTSYTMSLRSSIPQPQYICVNDYIIYEFNGNIFHIGKVINDNIFDLDDNDILAIQSYMNS